MLLSEAIKEFTEWRSLKVKVGTVKGYNMILRQFCLFVRNCNIEQVQLKDIIGWFKLMQMLEWDTNSFIPKAMALRKLFEFFGHRGYNVVDPWLIPLPRKDFKMPRVADEENYQKLLSTIPLETNDPRHIRNRAIINLFWDTGARHGEILGLNMDDLNIEKKKAVIKTEKNRGSKPFRELFWTPETNENIKWWLSKRKQLEQKMTFKEPEAVFVSICGSGTGKTSGGRFTIKGSGEMLRRYCNRAKIPFMNAHSIRHKKTHDIFNDGGNVIDAMNINGWASMQSAAPYARMFGKELEGRARMLMDKRGKEK